MRNRPATHENPDVPAQAVEDHRVDPRDHPSIITLGIPRDNEKWGSIRRICGYYNHRNSSMTERPILPQNQINPPREAPQWVLSLMRFWPIPP
jgi:hypothetical protein